MPYGPKHPEVKQARREEGLKMKGTGVGQRVKGKKWERTLRGRLEERRRAMEGMPEMIREWKRLGHGRGWKKWPK
jgi:large subunit ribosomal protein L25